jgi:genome maintenance exonuclease 1
MHSYLEHWVKTGTHREAGTNPFSWPSHAMAGKVIQEGLSRVTEFWGTEVPLYFPKIYAGTTDCVGMHDGQQTVMDFKQTNKPKKTEWIEDYFLQLAAYAEAHNEVYGTRIQRGVILMCAKPVEDPDRPGIFLEPPRYQEWIIEGEDFDLWTRRWWDRVEQYYQRYA